jgi:hypothetical protein
LTGLGLRPNLDDQFDAFGLEFAAAYHLEQVAALRHFARGATPNEKSVRAFPALTLSEITPPVFFRT